MVKVNPVFEDSWNDILAYIEDYKQSAPRGQWGKLVGALSGLALLVDFAIFCVFVAAVGASWGIVIALYYDMVNNTIGMLLTHNHYLMMSFVILRIFGVLALVGADAYFTYLASQGSDLVFYSMSLTTWLIVFSTGLLVYLVFSIYVGYYAVLIIKSDNEMLNAPRA